MWDKKDALHAVKKHFHTGETCLLMMKTHRLAGMKRTESLFLLSALSIIPLSAFLIQNKTPLYWLMLIVLLLISVKILARRLCNNHIILTDLALYRHTRIRESKIMISSWANVASVSVKRSGLFRSAVIVEIVCRKEKLPKRILLPKKLFVMRFGKLKLSRAKIDFSATEPVKQRFAISSSNEFLQILGEIQSMPGYSFEIHTKGV